MRVEWACAGMEDGAQVWTRAWECIDQGVGMCGHVQACSHLYLAGSGDTHLGDRLSHVCVVCVCYMCILCDMDSGAGHGIQSHVTWMRVQGMAQLCAGMDKGAQPWKDSMGNRWHGHGHRQGVSMSEG